LRFFVPQGQHVAPMGVKLPIDCKKSAIGNGNLQPEIEINEYSSSKNYSSSLPSSTRVLVTRVVLEYSSTRESRHPYFQRLLVTVKRRFEVNLLCNVLKANKGA